MFLSIFIPVFYMAGDDEAKSVESITDTKEDQFFVKPIAVDESMADDEEDKSDLNTSGIKLR